MGEASHRSRVGKRRAIDGETYPPQCRRRRWPPEPPRWSDSPVKRPSSRLDRSNRAKAKHQVQAASLYTRRRIPSTTPGRWSRRWSGPGGRRRRRHWRPRTRYGPSPRYYQQKPGYSSVRYPRHHQHDVNPPDHGANLRRNLRLAELWSATAPRTGMSRKRTVEPIETTAAHIVARPTNRAIPPSGTMTSVKNGAIDARAERHDESGVGPVVHRPTEDGLAIVPGQARSRSVTSRKGRLTASTVAPPDGAVSRQTPYRRHSLDVVNIRRYGSDNRLAGALPIPCPACADVCPYRHPAGAAAGRLLVAGRQSRRPSPCRSTQPSPAPTSTTAAPVLARTTTCRQRWLTVVTTGRISDGSDKAPEPTMEPSQALRPPRSLISASLARLPGGDLGTLPH